MEPQPRGRRAYVGLARTVEWPMCVEDRTRLSPSRTEVCSTLHGCGGNGGGGDDDGRGDDSGGGDIHPGSARAVGRPARVVDCTRRSPSRTGVHGMLHGCGGNGGGDDDDGGGDDSGGGDIHPGSARAVGRPARVVDCTRRSPSRAGVHGMLHGCGGCGGGGAKVGSSRPCALCAHETACGRRRRLKAASMAEGW